MSTRAQIRFATREAGQSFNKHPNAYCETCGQEVQLEDACVFVGLPTELINKYSQTK
jgi:hypothetical protein